jgi:hypothetical protein
MFKKPHKVYVRLWHVDRRELQQSPPPKPNPWRLFPRPKP